jgi:hypothetical protein
LATNGAVTFINGAKTVIVAICHWNELPAAADTPALASATLRPPAGGAAPAAAQATAGNASPAAAAKGIKPAAQQAASTPSKGQTPAQTAKPTTPIAPPFTHTVTRFKCTGQEHHAITKRIHKALEDHDVLKGLYKYRDNRFVTQAINKEAHKGYQTWHRAMEDKVVDWLQREKKATPAQFEAWLRDLYKTDKTLDWRFPNGF